MKIEFLGVGEAEDEDYFNSSTLVFAASTPVLVDCGFLIPPRVFTSVSNPNAVPLIVLTHLHGDHCFGIPLLLLRWRTDGRTEPLIILGPPGVEARISMLLDLAYPSLRNALPYRVSFHECPHELRHEELEFQFARTRHSVENYAVRIEGPRGCIGISGDGASTDESRALLKTCNLIVHEAFTSGTPIANHESIETLGEWLSESSPDQTIALVHLQRNERREKLSAFQKLQSRVPARVIIPFPGDVIKVGPSHVS